MYALMTVALQEGDTGSLVVDLNTGVAYGHIIATTTSFAYILPLYHTIATIQKQLGEKSKVLLASPFECLAEIAKSMAARNDESATTAFAREALSSVVLSRSPPTPVIKLIEQHKADNGAMLRWIITKAGADFRDAFLRPEFWSEAVKKKKSNFEFDMGIVENMSRALSIEPPTGDKTSINTKGFDSHREHDGPSKPQKIPTIPKKPWEKLWDYPIAEFLTAERAVYKDGKRNCTYL
jgi:hypothetical protein